MGFKSLFLVDDGSSKEEKVSSDTTTFPAQATTSFPTQATTSQVSSFPTTPVFNNQVNNEHISKFVEKYQSTFDSLNQTGYDFYEFYNAIIKTNGIDNLQMYQMALSMAIAMDSTISKEKLLSQADFYLGEINKIYNQFVNDGNTKKSNLVSQKDTEKELLTGELSSLNEQLALIQNQIAEKQKQLSTIESKYMPLIAEIGSKLAANDTAKNDLIGKISKVKNNLLQI
jgi:hypothetical protein